MASGGSIDTDILSDETFDLLCTVCKRKGKNLEADKFCIECQDYYCLFCVKVHEDVPLLTGHRILDKRQFLSGSGKTRPVSIKYLPVAQTERCEKHIHHNIEMQSSVFQEPQCLIDSHFNIDDKLIQEIQQIDKKVVVVAIVGLYRTGKSYLMNRLAGKTSGFPLGNTTAAKTKGIWVWCIDHPKQKDTVLILLDTEGLGDVKRGDINHDNKMCTLASLLCNVLVYNIMTVFNQDALEKLTFIAEMSKNIKFKNDFDQEKTDYESKENNEKDRLHLIAPTFVLCVRDFTLCPTADDDEEISADEYLTDCLRLKHSSEDDDKQTETERFNRTRQCVVEYFPKRKCFTFDLPGNRNVLRHMDTAKEEDLSTTFLEDVKAFLSYIYTANPKRMFHSKSINGAIFADLLQSYVQEIRSGKNHDVDDAFTVAANKENERMMEKAILTFKQKLRSLELPIFKVETFEDLYFEIQRVSLTVFTHKSVFNAERFIDKAKERMKTIWQDEKAKNLELVVKCITIQLSDHFETIVGDTNKYMVVNGAENYDSKFTEVLQKFKEDVNGVDANVVEQVIVAFKQSLESTKKDIIAADRKLTGEEAERKFNELKTQMKNDSQKRIEDLQKQMNSKKEEAEKKIQEMKDKHEKEIAEQMRLITHRKDKLREELEKAMQRKSEEKEGESLLRLKKAIEIEEYDVNVQDEWENTDNESMDYLDTSIRSKNDETRRENTKGPLAGALRCVQEGRKCMRQLVVSVVNCVIYLFSFLR